MVTPAVMEMTAAHEVEQTALPFEPVIDPAALIHPDLSLLAAVIDCFPGLVTPATDTTDGAMAVLVGPDRFAMLYHEDWWYRFGTWETTAFTLAGKDGPVSRTRRARLLAERHDIVRDVLDAMLSRTPYSLDFFLHGDREQQDRCLLRAAASLWHDLRVREGHTPESAFFLLTMTLAPRNAALLSLAPDSGRVALTPEAPDLSSP